MVTLTPDELNDMKKQIAAGKLPPDAVLRDFENEARNVFGFDAKHRRDGSYVEQGVGSPGNMTRNSIDAYNKYGPMKSITRKILLAWSANWLPATNAGQQNARQLNDHRARHLCR